MSYDEMKLAFVAGIPDETHGQQIAHRAAVQPATGGRCVAAAPAARTVEL
jgi:hypothetical protein